MSQSNDQSQQQQQQHSDHSKTGQPESPLTPVPFSGNAQPQHGLLLHPTAGKEKQNGKLARRGSVGDQLSTLSTARARYMDGERRRESESSSSQPSGNKASTHRKRGLPHFTGTAGPPPPNQPSKLRRSPSLKSSRVPSPGLLRKRASAAGAVVPGSSTASPPFPPMLSVPQTGAPTTNGPVAPAASDHATLQPQPSITSSNSNSSSSTIISSSNRSQSPARRSSPPTPAPAAAAPAAAAATQAPAAAVTLPTPPLQPPPTSGAPPQFQQRVEQVLRARLYLLQQSGPNSFIIAGDSTDQKFKVIIGSQKCSCAKVNCIHVLFVMLRVLKVEHTSTLLWSKKLHNFEAESLLTQFRNRQARRMQLSSLANRRHSTGGTAPRRKALPAVRSTSVIDRATAVNIAGIMEDAGLPAVVVSVSPLASRQSLGKKPPDHGDNGEVAAGGKASEESGSDGERTTSTPGCSPEEAATTQDAEAAAYFQGGGDASTGTSSGLAEEDDEEEEVCPICLLEMVDGESMITCTEGCHNRLHLHCIRIWALERRKQGEPLHCPLCRADWPDLPTPTGDGSSSQGLGSLAFSDPVPEEFSHKAAAWMKVFNRDTVSSIFSRGWLTRQNGLSHLQRDFMSKLMDNRRSTSSSLPTDGADVRPESMPEWLVNSSTGLWESRTLDLIACSLEIVEQCVLDKVIGVYETALDFFQTILTYTPVSSEQQLSFLRHKVAETLNQVMTKCAELHRRKRDRSMKLLTEFCLDQQGRMSLGSALGANQSALPLGGVSFILDLATTTEDERRHDVQARWQYWLGRLRLIDMLLTSDMLPPCQEEEWSSDEERKECVACVASQLCPSLLQESPPPPATFAAALVRRALPLRHVVQALLFARSALKVQQINIARISRRVFLLSARLALTWGEGARCLVRAVVDCLNSPHYGTLRQKLGVHAGDDDDDSGGSRGRDSQRCRHYRVRSRPFMAAGVGPVSSALSPPPSDSDRSFYVPSGPELDESGDFSPLCSSGGMDVVVEATRPQPVTTSSVENSAVPSPASGSRASTSMSVSRSQTSLAPRAGGGDDDDDALLRRQSSSGSATPDVGGGGGGGGTSPALLRTSSDGDPQPSDDSGAADDDGDAAPGVTEVDGPGGSIQPIIRFAIGEGVREQEQTGTVDNTNAGDFSDSGFVSGGDTNWVQSSGMSSKPLVLKGTPLKGKDSTNGLTEQGQSHEKPKTTRSLSKIMRLSSPSSLVPAHHIDRFDSGIGEQQQSYQSSCQELVEAEVEATRDATEASLYEVPLPPLHGLAPPDELVSVHQQPTDGEQPDGGNNIYIEGVHWKKGPMIGTGAFSTVFAARDVAVGTLMCAKQVSFVRNTAEEQERVVRDIQDEVTMLSRLEHPNVVRCLGATREATHFYIFVEWMPGGSVAEILRRYGAFTERVTTLYLQHVLRGTAYLHDNRVIHRDIKGANILVDSTGQHVRLSDFGTSARLQAHLTGDKEFEGDGHGTVAFMAPEVLRGDPYGRSSDVWSIGCTTVEMLSGQPPWGAGDATNRFRLIFRIASATQPPDIPAFCPPALRDVCLRCMEMQPTERPRAADLLKHPAFSNTAGS